MSRACAKSFARRAFERNDVCHVADAARAARRCCRATDVSHMLPNLPRPIVIADWSGSRASPRTDLTRLANVLRELPRTDFAAVYMAFRVHCDALCCARTDELER